MSKPRVNTFDIDYEPPSPDPEELERAFARLTGAPLSDTTPTGAPAEPTNDPNWGGTPDGD